MAEKTSLITIGMPVFNDIDFIEESIISILKQTVKSFKLVISDDGSSDGSADICKRYAAEDSRIIYIRQPVNLGISKNMEFLLTQADTPYFMWAADDDLWAPTFIQELTDLLKANVQAVAAFCTYAYINETSEVIKDNMNLNYGHENTYQRLVNYVHNASDEFGYGVFKTKKIQGVKFPIWAWPNHKTPYNNIYPSLCFYLAKGNYVNQVGKALFLKRMKTPKKTNHVISGAGSAIKESLFYFIRRLNLVFYSSRLIRKASSVSMMFRVFPHLFFHWFMKSSWEQVKLAGNAFLRNRLR